MSPKAAKALEPAATDPSFIRNFCIIAHIDHGKSTLADRMLSVTGAVSDRDMRAQYLDRMDIERERGITIKSQAVRMPWEVDGQTYALNMIDTPGHVDFTYEVSRSLAACEGAILLVDAAQGIEAQTLANLYLAMENDLEIIPVLNKIDLPAADPEKYAKELANLIGGSPDDVLKVSGKTGVGVDELLDRVVAKIPHPVGDPDAPTRAMIFDSVYDTYRGVITYVRMIDGHLSPRERIQMMSTRAVHELLEIGVSSPEPVPTQGLGVGEVGVFVHAAAGIAHCVGVFAADKGLMRLNENYIALSADLGPQFKLAHRILFDMGAEMALYSTVQDWSSARMHFTPHYVYNKGRWHIDAGVRIDFLVATDNDAAPRSVERQQIVYPDVRVEFTAIRNAMNIYAEATGGNRINTYGDVVRRNHFADVFFFSGTRLDATVERVNAALGLKGRIGTRFSYNFKGGYAGYANAMFDALYTAPDLTSRLFTLQQGICVA